jgi:hypothetical protein
VQFDILVLAESQGQRVHCASVHEIPHHADVQPIDAARVFLDGEEIQDRLRGVLVRTITGVEDRHVDMVGSPPRRAVLRVADHHPSTLVRFIHIQGVREALTLLYRGTLSVKRVSGREG